MLHIPENKLPGFAKDEERLTALFSPVRSQTVNPRDWENKIISWKDLIFLYCESNSIYTVTLSSLNVAFVRHGRPPPCLKDVLEDMIRKGELVPLDEFLKKSPRSWTGWAADLIIKRPISWSFNTLKKSIFTPGEITYVHLGVIKSDAKKLFAEFPDRYRNKLVDFEKFMDIFMLPANQEKGIKLLLHYLETEGKCCTTTLNCAGKNLFLIKMGYLDGVKPVSELDVGMFTLQRNEKCFSDHVEILEEEINNYIKEAKLQLQKGHRALAKTILRKKQEVQKRLERKLNALHNIQSLLQKLEDVHENTEVWKSYQLAIEAFNATFKEKGLNEEAVEDTMAKVGDMIEMHEDIQTILSKPVVETESEEDLEEELAELLNNDKKPSKTEIETDEDLEEIMRKLDLSNLPEILSHNLSQKEVSLN